MTSPTCYSYLPPVVQPVYLFHGHELITAADAIPAVAPNGTPATAPTARQRLPTRCRSLSPHGTDGGFVLAAELCCRTVLHKLPFSSQPDLLLLAPLKSDLHSWLAAPKTQITGRCICVCVSLCAHTHAHAHSFAYVHSSKLRSKGEKMTAVQNETIRIESFGIEDNTINDKAEEATLHFVKIKKHTFHWE